LRLRSLCVWEDAYDLAVKPRLVPIERETVNAYQLAARLADTVWHFRREAGLPLKAHPAERQWLVFAALALLGRAAEEPR
jgi:hypothetical protein